MRVYLFGLCAKGFCLKTPEAVAVVHGAALFAIFSKTGRQS